MHTCGIGEKVDWENEEFNGDDACCRACQAAFSRLASPVRSQPIDSWELESAEIRLSGELADYTEQEGVRCDARLREVYEKEGIPCDARLVVHESDVTYFSLFSPSAASGRSSYTDAGLGALGVCGVEVAVDLPEGCTGKSSGCSIPIVSRACMSNSCRVVMSGSVGRRYDQFIRRRGSAGRYPPTNTTSNRHIDMRACVHCHASTHARGMLSNRESGSSALLTK